MILLTRENMANRLSWIILILISVQVVQTLSAFSDVPPPPLRPERFHSREELKRYLQLVHEYYAIIGRPRFGRSLFEQRSSLSDRRLFNFFDINDDNSITFDEFQKRLEND
ncbi:unnamed protein product [Rotaria sp. Silwood2]|nr:unnamed protein product [Rotaria sp. Silwood2]CAF2967256.1 unnamed protein product [Rotaria sp. Silwood2]CAF3199225.1 unnamed protein product [Rotaria sp. Silwood2]CAF3953765.1 unnamed protein product [Rotaria sp. Silwood2]CAF4499552.1 unnamed protein product [Rotaria sp. Silwood2]